MQRKTFQFESEINLILIIRIYRNKILKTTDHNLILNSKIKERLNVNITISVGPRTSNIAVTW